MNNAEHQQLWTKNYILTIVVSLLVGSAINMLMTTIPLYAKYLGGNNTMSGLVVGVYAFSSLLCRPFVGRLLDQRGRKTVLLGGISILAVIFFFYYFAATVLILLILRIIQGVGFSAHNTSVNTIAADIVPTSRLSEGIGYFSISLTLPTAFGPSLGLWLIDRYGYGMLFHIAFFLVLGGLCTAFFLKDGNRSAAGTESTRFSPDSLIEKNAIRESGVMFFIALGLGGIISFLTSFGTARGIAGIGTYFTVYAAFLMVARLFSGRIADRFGTGSVAIPGILSVLLSFLILAFSHSLLPCLVSAVFFGLGYGVLLPVMNADMIRKCPVSRKGAANATFTAAMDIGMGVGSILWGVISQSFGFLPVYLLCGLCSVFSLCAFLLGRRKVTRRLTIEDTNK